MESKIKTNDDGKQMYISSNGKETPIEEMATQHLGSAIAKMSSQGGDVNEINTLQTEYNKREKNMDRISNHNCWFSWNRENSR